MSSTPLSPRQDAQRHYIVVMLGFICQLLLQLGLQKLLAYRFGSSLEMDAYVHAINVPLGISAIIAGTTGPVLITLQGQGSRDDLRRFVAMLTVSLSGGLVLLASILNVFSIDLMQHLNPGFSGEKLHTTAATFRILVWLIPLNVLIGLLQSLHNARLHFRLPALAGVLGPACTVLLLCWTSQPDVTTVAWATVAGALANVLLQFPWALPEMSWSLTGVGSHFRSLMSLGIPILAGMLLLRLDLFVDKYVLSLLRIDGASAQQNWAWQIQSGFLMLASGALSTVTFPRIAARVHDGPEALAREIAQSFGMLILLCVPAMAAIGIFGQSLIRDIFEGGEFTSRDTAAVGRLLQLYAPMILGAALSEQSGKIMTALRDTVTPNIVLSTCVAAGFITKLTLVPTRDVNTLVIITSAMWLMAGVVQFGIVLRRIGLGCLVGTQSYLLTSCLGTVIAVSAGWGVLRSGLPFSGLAGLGAGGLGYGALLLLRNRLTSK